MGQLNSQYLTKLDTTFDVQRDIRSSASGLIYLGAAPKRKQPRHAPHPLQNDSQETLEEAERQ